MPTEKMAENYEFEFPAGGRIAMGESATPDGSALYLSLTAAGASEPSLVFWIDGQSLQPMLTFRAGPDGQRTVPLDKLIGSIRNLGTGSLLAGR